MFKNQYREKTYVDEILNNGFTSKHLFHEMKLLAKHFKELGFDDEKRKEELYNFSENNIKDFNKVVYFKTINKALSYVTNKDEKLVQIDGINISKSESDYIEKLDIDDNLKKLVFTLLTLTKLNKNYLELRDGELKTNKYYFGGHQNYRELTSCSKVTFDKKKGIKNIHDMIGILDQKKIVEIVGKGNIKLLFMYEIEDDENESILVDKFDVIGYFYDMYKGDKKIKRCENEECNTLIRANNNKMKYCKGCAKAINIEKTIKNRRKWALFEIEIPIKPLIHKRLKDF